jgi:hypothetical protein
LGKKRSTSHYIDNKKFMDELVLHKKAVKRAKREGTKPPGVSNYIGQCFLDIATNLSTKPNFANYTYRDEMISDSIENCIMYATNFDPRKSKNPFAFFTQIIYYAFIRRIQKEKKQQYIKMRAFEQNDPTGKFRNWMEEEHRKYQDSTQSPFVEFITADPTEIRGKTKGKRKRRKIAKDGLDDLMEN